jgi:uncharacterized membrane protein
LKEVLKVSKADWQKRFAILRSRLYLYPAPEPMSHTPLFWVAMGLVCLAVVAFSVYFLLMDFGRLNAYIAPGEDLGIYDQAIWSLVHGSLFHQTICNIVSDTNCFSLNGISRFAIHFEPILFPISLLYLVIPGPKTLLVLQTLVVAIGAFPAFWLARLRLRNELAAVGIALLYLLYPALQQAENFDFHAVTMTASLLLFTLYFMYTRRTVWLFVFAILSMACKEEIPLVIAVIGLWSMIFQQRWRTGLALVTLSIAWLGLVLLVYHLASPTGSPLLSSRYGDLGSGPVQILATVVKHPISLIRNHLLEPAHKHYVLVLLAPAGYLPLLAPWVLIMAFPSIAINLLSSSPNQYSGNFHYSAEIVPVLIFSTIEAIVLVVWLAGWYTKTLREQQGASQSKREQVTAQSTMPLIQSASPFWRWMQLVSSSLLVIFALFMVLRENIPYGLLPYSRYYSWPYVTTHEKLASHFEAMIPPTASVSAQTTLVPHVSERKSIYLFPYGDTTADYIFLDVTNYTSPFDSSPYNSPAYIAEVKKVLLSGNYGVVAAQDGYLLLKRGLPSPGISRYFASETGEGQFPVLPDEFCSFSRVSPQQVQHPLQVDFTPADDSRRVLSLVGYSVSHFDSIKNVQVTAYWRVNTPELPPLRIELLMYDTHGKEEFSSVDFPALSWCPTSTWKPGTILRTISSSVGTYAVPNGLAHVAIALLPLSAPLSTISSVAERLPLQIVKAPPSVTPIEGTNALQLDSFIKT